MSQRQLLLRSRSIGAWYSIPIDQPALRGAAGRTIGP